MILKLQFNAKIMKMFPFLNYNSSPVEYIAVENLKSMLKNLSYPEKLRTKSLLYTMYMHRIHNVNYVRHT